MRYMFTVARCTNFCPQLIKELRSPAVLKDACFHKPSPGHPSLRLSNELTQAALVSLGIMAVEDNSLAKKCLRGFTSLLKSKNYRTRLNCAAALASIMARHHDLNARNLSEIYPLLFDEVLEVRSAVLAFVVDLLQESHLKVSSRDFKDNSSPSYDICTCGLCQDYRCEDRKINLACLEGKFVPLDRS
jgi:hypothetical protein